MLGLLLLWLIAAIIFSVSNAPPPPAAADLHVDGDTDVVLYQTIIAGIRGGGNYYAVAADALRQGDFPLKPFVTFRLPTLAVIEAWLPPAIAPLLLDALVAAVVAAWAIRLRPALTRNAPLIVAIVLLAGGLIAFVQSELAVFHEIRAAVAPATA